MAKGPDTKSVSKGDKKIPPFSIRNVQQLFAFPIRITEDYPAMKPKKKH